MRNKIADVLKQLKFSEIDIAPTPDRMPASLRDAQSINPCIVAQKNGFTYLFKTIKSKNDLSEENLKVLKGISGVLSNKEMVQLILVVPYGTKAKAEQTASTYNLPISDVWEVTTY